MRALVLENGGVRFRDDAPIPEVPAGHALVRVVLAGICATDLSLTRGLYTFEGVLGHEFVGIVESVNADGGHDHLHAQRVVGEINLSCRHCDRCASGATKYCRNRRVLGIRSWDGAFADYLVLPVENLHTVPDHLSNDALVFTEPLAAALDILERVSIDAESSVAVIGDGRIGQLSARVLRGHTERIVVFGRHESKLARLPSQIRGVHVDAATDERDFDVVIECSGSVEGARSALNKVRPGGSVVLKSTCAESLSLSGSEIVVNEIAIFGSRCGDFPTALRFLSDAQKKDQDLASLVDARFSIEAGLDALYYTANEPVIKVVLDMG